MRNGTIKQKGSVPSKVRLTQPQTVIKYPCCSVIFLIFIRLARNNDKPINRQIIDELRKCDQPALVQYISKNAGISIANPNTLIRYPLIIKTGCHIRAFPFNQNGLYNATFFENL